MCIFLLLGVVLVEALWLMLAAGWVIPLIIVVARKLRNKPARIPGIVLAVWLPISCMLVAVTCLVGHATTYLISRLVPVPQ